LENHDGSPESIKFYNDNNITGKYIVLTKENVMLQSYFDEIKLGNEEIAA